MHLCGDMIWRSRCDKAAHRVVYCPVLPESTALLIFSEMPVWMLLSLFLATPLRELEDPGLEVVPLQHFIVTVFLP